MSRSRSPDAPDPRTPTASDAARHDAAVRDAAVRDAAGRDAAVRDATYTALRVPAPDAWRDAWRSFLRARGTVRAPLPPAVARAHLAVDRALGTAAAINQGPKGVRLVPLLVRNEGNVASYTAVVRVLEARGRNPIYEKIPIGEFVLRGRLDVPLQPGETREVRVPFDRQRADAGTFIAIVSDPLTDPDDTVVADDAHRRLMLANMSPLP